MIAKPVVITPQNLIKYLAYINVVVWELGEQKIYALAIGRATRSICRAIQTAIPYKPGVSAIRKTYWTALFLPPFKFFNA
jgi:hypothetical protein